MKSKQAIQSKGYSFKKKSTIVAVVIAIVIVASLGLILYLRKDTEEVVLQVGDERISQSSYDQFINNAKEYEVKPQEAREHLVDYYKTLAAAKEASVTLPKASTRNIRTDIYQEHGVQGTSKSQVYLNALVYIRQVEAHIATLPHSGYYTTVYTGFNNTISNSETDKKNVTRNYLDKLRDTLLNNKASDSDITQKIIKDDKSGEISQYQGFLTIDGEWINRDGMKETRQTGVGLDRLLDILRKTDSGTSEVLYDKDGSMYYFVNTIEKNNADTQKTSAFMSAKQAVRVVEYDR